MLTFKDKSTFLQIIDSLDTDFRSKEAYRDALKHFGTIDVFQIVGDPQEDPVGAFQKTPVVSRVHRLLLARIQDEKTRGNKDRIFCLQAWRTNLMIPEHRLSYIRDISLADLWNVGHPNFTTPRRFLLDDLGNRIGNAVEQAPLDLPTTSNDRIGIPNDQAIVDLPTTSNAQQQHVGARKRSYEDISCNIIPSKMQHFDLRLYCERCQVYGHHARNCPNGGYMYKGANGEPVPNENGGAPRCFVCSRRYPILELKIGDETRKIVHCSTNCPYRHPKSYEDVERNCSCGQKLQRCWRCAEPACVKRYKWNCVGHLTSRCPHKTKDLPTFPAETLAPPSAILQARIIQLMGQNNPNRRRYGKIVGDDQMPMQQRAYQRYLAQKRYMDAALQVWKSSTEESSKELLESHIALQQIKREPMEDGGVEQIHVPQPIMNMDTECIICSEHRKGELFFELPCSHIFHYLCIANWARSQYEQWMVRTDGNFQCPCCKKEFSLWEDVQNALDYVDVGEEEWEAMEEARGYGNQNDPDIIFLGFHSTTG